MKIFLTDGHISDYKNMMVYIKKPAVGEIALILYKEDEIVNLGRIVAIVNEGDTKEADDPNIETVDEIIDSAFPDVIYTNTAEFIINGKVCFVAIYEELVGFASDVTAKDFNYSGTSYC